MANITFDGLPSKGVILPTDTVNIRSSGIDYKTTGQEVLDLIRNNDTETINTTGGTVTLSADKHAIILGDTSSGDITINNFAGTFEGQRCTIISDGTGTVKNNGGNGDYVNGVYISPESTGLSYKKTWIDGSWRAVNEVTAETSIVGQVARLYSTGYMILDGRAGNDIAVTTARGALYSSGTFTPTAFSLAFTAPPKGSGKIISQNGANFAWSESRLAATATQGETMRLLSTVSVALLTYAKLETYGGYYA